MQALARQPRRTLLLHPRPPRPPPQLTSDDHSPDSGLLWKIKIQKLIFAPDRACGGRCLVLEMEILAHVVRCPRHAAVGLGLVIRAEMVSAPSAQSRTNGSRGRRASPQAPTARRSESIVLPSQWSSKSVGHQSTARASLLPSGSRTGNAGPTARGSVTCGTDLGQPSRLGIART